MIEEQISDVSDIEDIEETENVLILEKYLHIYLD